MNLRCNEMMESGLNDEVAGGGERLLDEKLPDDFKVEAISRFLWGLSLTNGAIELHRLAWQDPAQLERRKEEITVEIINATCSMTCDDVWEWLFVLTFLCQYN